MTDLTTRFLINKLNITIVVILSVILSITHFTIQGIDVAYVLSSPFAGYIPGGIFIPQWALFVITNLFIIYTIGVFYEKLIANGACSHIIRYCKKINWIRRLESTVIKGVLIFSLIYALVSFVIGVLFGANIVSGSANFSFFSLLWILEMVVVAEVFITLCICIKKPLISFYIMLLGYMMVGLPSEISCYIPFGISSVKRMAYYKLDSGFDISLIFLILVGTFIMARFILYRYGKARMFSN
ncbi:MAG: hypothetical protein RR539_09165 [Clostridium sp.]|uniref:hypothetical protein n=1 Tax=Clostridium sp. TaxID=1506 RepID=UPI002FCB2ADE